MSDTPVLAPPAWSTNTMLDALTVDAYLTDEAKNRQLTYETIVEKLQSFPLNQFVDVECETLQTISNDNLLATWYDSQSQLKRLKDEEMELRKEVVARFFDPEDKEGTKRYDLPDGFKLKVVKKQNYKLLNDKGQLDAALETLKDDTLAELLVKWTPTLSVTTYKALTPTIQAVLNGTLEITDASPTLEIEEPKTKK